MFLFYVAASTVLYVGGDIIGKFWALNQDARWFWVGILMYSIGGIASFYAIREESLSLALLVIPPFAIILSLLAGKFIFDERLSVVQYATGAVILLAVVVLLWNPKLGS